MYIASEYAILNYRSFKLFIIYTNQEHMYSTPLCLDRNSTLSSIPPIHS